MNWFQIVFLREDSQALVSPQKFLERCELISNCIFTWGFTSCQHCSIFESPLWIDFKLYFYVRIHKFHFQKILNRVVVNWFQIVFLREDSQGTTSALELPNSCELISNCIFTWGFTRRSSSNWIRASLWIDFKLYFYVRIHKLIFLAVWFRIVVNWFQIVFLREDSQVFEFLIAML